MEIPIEITNDTANVIIQVSDPIISLASFLITIVLVIGTLIGVYYSNKHTVNSNNLMREEMKNRLRPWIKVGLMESKTITLNDNHIIDWNSSKIDNSEYRQNVKHVTMAVPIENVGNLPTTTRSHTVLFQKKEFDKIELRNTGKHLEKGPLMPSEEIHYYFDIPTELWKGEKGDVLFYIGIEVDYTIDKDNSYKVGKIWRVYHDTCLLTSTGYWIN